MYGWSGQERKGKYIKSSVIQKRNPTPVFFSTLGPEQSSVGEVLLLLLLQVN